MLFPNSAADLQLLHRALFLGGGREGRSGVHLRILCCCFPRIGRICELPDPGDEGPVAGRNREGALWSSSRVGPAFTVDALAGVQFQKVKEGKTVLVSCFHLLVLLVRSPIAVVIPVFVQHVESCIA
jgi:hypothetical protein